MNNPFPQLNFISFDGQECMIQVAQVSIEPWKMVRDTEDINLI